jgi:hypothetical protein
LHDGCFKNNLAHVLVNPNQWIENVNWIIVTNHTKNKCFHTILEVNNPILGDCGKIILHHIRKHLEMFTLVITWWIWIHHTKIWFVDLYNHYKITNECPFLMQI